MKRHALPRFLEIPVVMGDQHRHTACHSRIDLLRRLSPLLHGIMKKNIFINIICNLTDLRVFMLPKLQDRYTALQPKCIDELLLQCIRLLLLIYHMKGVQVEGHRDQLAMDICHNLMSKCIPVRKTREIVIRFLLLCMENVRSILVDQDSMFILLVIAVAADMVSLLQYQHLSSRFCQIPGCHTASHTSTNDHTIKHILLTFLVLFLSQRNVKILCISCKCGRNRIMFLRLLHIHKQ